MRKKNREFTRLTMHAKANMLFGNHRLDGEVGNLSLKGAFVTAG
jgi:hypothetical protein